MNADDMETALQLSGKEFKGSALKVEVSQKKSQPETPGKAQEKGGKAGKGKAGRQEDIDAGDSAFFIGVNELPIVIFRKKSLIEPLQIGVVIG